MIGIVVALPTECGSLLRDSVRVGQTVSLGPGMLLRISGMGPQRAVAAATALQRAGAKAILSWGCSAALKPELRPGQLLLPEAFITPEGNRVTPDAGWWASLSQCLADSFEPVTVPLAGTARILATPADKRALQQKSGAAAADMESAFLAHWAEQRTLPFIALRSVSDCAETVLPGAVQVATDARGDIDRLKLLGHIVRQPDQIPALIRLGKQFRSAHRQLTLVAKVIQPHMFCLRC